MKWLLKTEPDDYSWENLIKENNAVWDGVKAPAAIKNIKQMKPGDLALIYHTGKERAIIGIAEIGSYPINDPDDNNKLIFKINAIEKLPKAVTLKQIKESGMFADWDLVRLPRLSVMPVTPEQWETVLNWSKN
jgi:predicted RNA-binding protein with PUA-like domain